MGDREVLYSVSRLLSSLFRAAVENKIRSITFPGISCGVYHFPIAQAAQIAVHKVEIFLEKT
ncbi:MAG: macro domain-containing protein [Desulfuromusa sp.]|nr:macro domain-containing protein [Desulfuromusa sp.]